MKTTEFSNGRSYIQTARFRTYSSWSDSVRHHGELLSKDYRYKDARQHNANWQRYLVTIAPVYATAPDYSSKVGWFIQHYNLDRWDSLAAEVVPRPPV